MKQFQKLSGPGKFYYPIRVIAYLMAVSMIYLENTQQNSWSQVTTFYMFLPLIQPNLSLLVYWYFGNKKRIEHISLFIDCFWSGGSIILVHFGFPPAILLPTISLMNVTASRGIKHLFWGLLVVGLGALSVSLLHKTTYEVHVSDSSLFLSLAFLFSYCILFAITVDKANKRLLKAKERITDQKNEIEQQSEELLLLNEEISLEKHKSEHLLRNILPEVVANELKSIGVATPHQYKHVSVLFTDFKGFTTIAEQLSPELLLVELNSFFQAFDDICQKHGMEKIKTIGDAYMAAGGLPTPNSTNPLDAVNAALEMVEFVHKVNEEKELRNEKKWHIRIGVHTGEVIAGVVGKHKFAYDIWGDAVNLASRMESSGEVAHVNISESTFEFVKDKFHCIPRGKIEAKNKGLINMYFVSQK